MPVGHRACAIPRPIPVASVPRVNGPVDEQPEGDEPDLFEIDTDDILAAREPEAGDDPASEYEEYEFGDNEAMAAASNPVATARRKHGATGAILAAGMFGVDIALGRKPKEDVPIVVAASDKPVDLDNEGLIVPVDEHVSVLVPPQPRTDPAAPRPRRRRFRNR